MAFLRRRRGAGSHHRERGDPRKFRGYGLVLWLRADMGITLNGSNVSAWADQSGAGNHLAQATAAQQPAYSTANAGFVGRPTVNTDGVDDLLAAVGAFAPAAPRTVFTAVKTVTDRSIFGWNGGAFDIRLRRVGATSIGLLDTTALDNSADPVDTTVKHVYRGTYNSASSFIHIDGVQRAAGSLAGGAWSTITIGAVGPGFQVCQLEMAESVVFSGATLPNSVSVRIEHRLGALCGIAA